MNLSRVLSASTEQALPLLKSLLSGAIDSRDNEINDIIEIGRIRTICYHKWPVEGPLIPAWNHLLARVPEATVFQTPPWQRASLTWALRLGRLRLFTIWRENTLLAVLPLQLRSGGRLSSVGAIVSDYLDPLIDPAEHETVWHHLLTSWRDGPMRHRLVRLHNVRPNAACRAALKEIAPHEGFTLEERECGQTSSLELPGDWDAYLARLDRHDRKEVRRKLRNAETKANARLQVSGPEEDPAPALDRIFRFIESTGGEKRIKSRWLFRRLFRDAGAALAREHWLKLYTLMVGDRAAAGLITFPSPAGVVMTWGTGYDADLRTLSPGIVTFAMVIRDAIQAGVRSLDLLRGESDYKFRLGGTPRPLYELTLQCSTPSR